MDMTIRNVLRIIGAILTFPWLLELLAVSPEDLQKNAKGWTRIVLEVMPEWDARVIAATFLVIVLIGVYGALRWLLRLWHKLREHGVMLIPKRQTAEEWLTPLEAFNRFTDREVLNKRKLRVAGIWDARVKVELLIKERQELERKEERHSGPGAWPGSPKLQEVVGKLDEARMDYAGLIEWHQIYEQPIRAALAAKLARGELAARAYVDERLLAGTDIDVQAVQWTFLEIDYEHESASGRGVTYHHVRIKKV